MRIFHCSSLFNLHFLLADHGQKRNCGGKKVAMRVSVETCGCSVYRVAHTKSDNYNNNYDDNDVILSIDE